MKTRIIATIASIIISATMITVNASASSLTFYNDHGLELTVPVMEETAEEIPQEISEIFNTLRTEAEVHMHTFNIQHYSKPELEEELPFDLEEVLTSM